MNFTVNQLHHIQTFKAFCLQAPTDHCAVCNIILYPENVKINTNNVNEWPCQSYPNIHPIQRTIETRRNNQTVTRTGIVVCTKHTNARAPFHQIYYPGTLKKKI